jgi:outer membrane cobalamin receptor
MRIKVALISLLFTTSLQANEADLFSLSLEELMQVEIYTASQEMETAAESPATTSVITAKQLKEWGVLSLHDVMSFLPGIVKNETYLGQTTQTFRGVTPGIFNNKSLYLINGHPSYESLFGSTLLDYIPIEIVERIEVVRSPASVLYGTNAVSGVINIITKQGTDSKNTVSVRAGSNSHKYGSIVHHSDQLSMAASVQRDNGYQFSGTTDEFTNPVDLDYRYDVENLFIDSYGDDWRINIGFFDREKALYGVNPWIWQTGIFETYTGYLDANKKWTTDSGETNIWLRYDVSDKDIHVGAFPFPATAAECTAFNIPGPTPPGSCDGTRTDTSSTVMNKVERYSVELQHKNQLTSELSYIIGLTLEHQKSDPLIFVFDSDNTLNRTAIADPKDTNTSAIYAQAKYQMNEDTLFIAGIRGEDNSDSGSSDLMPRVGITHQIIPDTYIKLLYSEAFRTPMFIEKFVQLPSVLIGDENLNREVIKTLELGLESQINKSNRIQLALYTLDLDDEILRVLGTPPATIYVNGGGKEMQGLEIEWKSIMAEKVELTLNSSYVDGEDKSLNEKDAPFIANVTANAILTYHIKNNWSATLSTQYVGQRDTVLATTSQRITLESYQLVNFSTVYRKKEHEVRLTLNNITDEVYSYPEPIRRQVVDVPGGADTTAYLQYNYTF